MAEGGGNRSLLKRDYVDSDLMDEGGLLQDNPELCNATKESFNGCHG